jgi:hypothetical protein
VDDEDLIGVATVGEDHLAHMALKEAELVCPVPIRNDEDDGRGRIHVY